MEKMSRRTTSAGTRLGARCTVIAMAGALLLLARFGPARGDEPPAPTAPDNGEQSFTLREPRKTFRFTVATTF